MKKLMLLSLVFLTVISAACSRAEESTAGKKKEEKVYPMQAFVLKDLDGNEVSSDDLKGKVLLLDFWATWCGPCVSEIPDLNELHNRYKEKDFALLAIATQSGDAATIKKAAERLKTEYRVLVGEDEVARKYQVYAYPTDYLIDRNGNIKNRIIGAPPGKKEQLIKMIDELLEE